MVFRSMPKSLYNPNSVYYCKAFMITFVQVCNHVHIDDQHTFSACSASTKGPMPTKPFPVNSTIQEYGGNVTFYCTGDFGCLTATEIYGVEWWVDKKRVKSVSHRYVEVKHEE